MRQGFSLTLCLELGHISCYWKEKAPQEAFGKLLQAGTPGCEVCLAPHVFQFICM